MTTGWAAAVIVLCATLGCGRYHFEAEGRDGDVGDGTTDGAGDPDGGLDDGEVAVTPYNFIFVTSTTSPVTALAGLTPADDICNQLAADAGLPGQYVAWLSGDGRVAADRLGTARGWVRLDGKPIADTVADLLSGRIYHPILFDQTRTPIVDDVGVFTSTRTTGAAGLDCMGYTIGDDTQMIRVGIASATRTNWTDDSDVACDQPRRHYCFGVDKSEPLSVMPQTGPRAFVSQSSWVPSGGLAGADAFCQSAADARSLGGTWRAFLSSTTVPAGTRFDSLGPRWVRLDGIPLAPDRVTLLEGRPLDAPLNLNETLSYGGSSPVYSGSSDPQMVGSLTSTCQDWNDSSSTNGGLFGIMNSITRYLRFSFFPVFMSCNSGGALYCLEP